MINFGYDDIIGLDEFGNMEIPYPNFYSKELYGFDMDIYVKKYGQFPIKSKSLELNDYWLLIGRSISQNINDDLYKHGKNTIDYFIENNEDFVYPLLIWNNDMFDNNIQLTIPDKVMNQIKLGKCKIAIFYITEPWFMHQHCYEWLSNFSKENDLNKESFIFVSSNLLSPEVKERYVNEGIIQDNFTILGFNYFFHRLWFFQNRFHEDYSSKIYENKLNQILIKQKQTKKEKHFLCFNRKPHDHRVAIFAEVMTNNKLKDKTIITLGNENLIGGQIHKDAIRRFIDENYKHGHQRLYDYIDNFHNNIDYTFDTDSLVDEQSIHINLDVQCKAFCNVVTETLTAEDLLFFSEKIIKPIFSLQPFIIIGNRGSLKKLKEYGFKTFDKWWDESYDDLMYQNRFERIVELMEEISEWDENKINDTLLDMEETLIHNFNMLVEDNSTKEFFNKFITLIK